jgi:hypothetical protein
MTEGLAPPKVAGCRLLDEMATGIQMPRPRISLFLTVVIRTYLLLGAFTLALTLWPPDDDPLPAVFLAILAAPWSFVLDWMVDSSDRNLRWVSALFLSLGILVNALALRGLGRFVHSRRTRTDEA